MFHTASPKEIIEGRITDVYFKAVEPREIGGILGLAASVESSTRILAPIIGGALLQQYGTSAPGVFGAVVMVGVFFYVRAKIYNHPIVTTRQPVPSSTID